MGTNYYIEAEPPCPHCGRPYERKHIGKSSAGWCFMLHVYPDEGINTLDDWRMHWQGKKIVNEYGWEISASAMLDTITKSSYFRVNSSYQLDRYTEPGPHGLVRFRVGEAGCIGHGDTWDYMTGEFS